MIANGIDTKDISVIVQGAVDQSVTPKCLASIRKYLPGAEIILSTWEGTNITHLDYDEVLLSKDPGSFPMSKFEQNNVNRQLFSTLQGLKKANRKYALKIRSDIEITGTGFLHYFNKFKDYDVNWHFIKERIVVPSMLCRDPRIWESPMCPSDWCSFGLLEDMLALWDIPFPSVEEQNWFNNHPKTKEVNCFYEALISRYNPEQYIWISFCRKFIKNLHVDNMFDINIDSINETLYTFANNLIILSENQYGIRFLKQRRVNGDNFHIITYKQFIKIYNKYSNGKKNVGLIDFQKIALFKYAKKSIARLLVIAAKNDSLDSFIEKEAIFLTPLIKPILFPFILYAKKEYNTKIRIPKTNIMENKKMNNEEVKLSVVVPTHNRTDLFKETLESLEKQTEKDFEVIVTDDSSTEQNQATIKQYVEEAKKKGLKIRYIFTEKNLGQPKNTNQGLAAATGKYLRVLHSDDLISPNCLTKEIETFENNDDIAFLYHTQISFQTKNGLNFSTPQKNEYKKYKANAWLSGAIFTTTVMPSLFCFRREVYENCGGMREDYSFLCDWELFYRYLQYAEKTQKSMIHIPAGLIGWRVHQESTTGKLFFTHFLEHKKFCHQLKKDYIREQRLPRRVLGNLLANAMIYRNKRLVVDYLKQGFWGKVKNLPKLFVVLLFTPNFWIFFLLYFIFNPLKCLLILKNKFYRRLLMIIS